MSKIFILLAVALSAPVAAQQTLPDVSVSYNDLNLADPEGVRTLDHRIASAIKRACVNEPHADLRTARAAAQCRRDKALEVSEQRARALAHAGSATVVASAR